MIIAEMEFGTSFVDKEIEALINLKTFLVAWKDIKNNCHALRTYFIPGV